ncbi:4-hydroxybutyrate CoA-transferase [Lachnospiraceae bacterium ZAX-1]
MNWKEEYAEKICSAKDALSHIKSGDRVVVAHACSEPTKLIDTMVEFAEEYDYKDVELIHMVPMGNAPYCHPKMKERFRHNALFVGSATKEAVADNRADFTTIFFSEVPDLIRGELRPDVVLLQLSTPDEHGYCSFGASCDYTKPATEVADVKIAQINEKVPRTMGDNFIHISELDYVVLENAPMIQLTPPKIGDAQRKIGENIASLVKDRDCLQLGIGAIPDAVLLFLKNKKDLGIHSEMFSDGAVDLIKAGVINNKYKQIDKGQCVATFLMGTDKLYDYVDNNPTVKMMPVDYVNDPRVICQNDHVVAINSCVEVDLMGQVCSEAVGDKQISGVGGQVDFVRGAKMSKGGKTIIAMPATAAKGTISKIVPYLAKGAPVTTSRNDVDYIVTEYGIAKLHGKTLSDRAKALIAIAAPEFREDLEAEYTRRFGK